MTAGDRVRQAFREITARVRHGRDSLRCRDVVEIVTDYLEDALDVDARRRFERHVGACPECRSYIQQVQLTRDALGHLHPAPPTPETRAALLDAFRNPER